MITLLQIYCATYVSSERILDNASGVVNQGCRPNSQQHGYTIRSKFHYDIFLKTGLKPDLDQVLSK